MKLLLTSGGITNSTIANAFQQLIVKPFTETKVGFIPTAAFSEPGDKDWLVDDMYRIKSLGVELHIIDLAHLSPAEVMSRLTPMDVIFVGGGNTFYLSYWMQKSGLMAALPELLKTKVYAGISAGSMVVGQTLRITSHAMAHDQLEDDEYNELGPVGKSSALTAQLVQFSVRPHLNSRFFPNITGERVQKIANEMQAKIYAIDDQSAVRVVDGVAHVVSEGEWRIYDGRVVK